MPDETDQMPGGLSILVVEDEFLIALDIEEMLESHGHHVLGPVGTIKDALRLLEDERPDVATLDLNIRGQPVIPIARRLQFLRIPFVIVSANGSFDFPDSEVLVDVENVGKPIPEDHLIQALGRAINGA